MKLFGCGNLHEYGEYYIVMAENAEDAINKILEHERIRVTDNETGLWEYEPIRKRHMNAGIASLEDLIDLRLSQHIDSLKINKDSIVELKDGIWQGENA